MGKFKKRTFNSPGEFLKELKLIFKNRNKLKKLEKEEFLDDEFRERIMMAVTEVNGCRYCSYHHSKLALEAGISREELDSMLAGDFKNCPEAEILALIYAQHWAEKKGRPDQEMKDKVKAQYGEEKFEIISSAIRMINFGNLLGNSLDYFLYRFSFGLLGQND